METVVSLLSLQVFVHAVLTKGGASSSDMRENTRERSDHPDERPSSLLEHTVSAEQCRYTGERGEEEGGWTQS